MAARRDNLIRRHDEELDLCQLIAARLRKDLPELIRRDSERTGPDGYPTSTGGSATSTISTHSTGSSTESAGLRLAERGVDADPIHTFAVTAQRKIHDALGCLLEATNAVAAAKKVEDDNRGRQSSISECVNCGTEITGVGNDRVRAGRCPRCAVWRSRHGGEDWRPGDDVTSDHAGGNHFDVV